MAIGSENLIDDSENYHEHLVNNYSVNSFMSENHEFTITRSFGDRKYSTMCFKPKENTVDIVITQGEYPDTRREFFVDDIGSQDIRRKYSKKAKLGVGFVLVMLFVMTAILIFCLLTSPPGHSGTGSSEITAIIQQVNTSIQNTTYASEPLPGQTEETSIAANISMKTDDVYTHNTNI